MSLTGDVAGVVSGILNSGGVNTPDLTQLFETIRSAGANQQNLINALPEALKPLYANYVSSNQQTGTNLTTGASSIGDKLQAETEANYGPEVTKAALDAAKSSIYADLPGQEAAVREALASSGGFDRGTASKQLAAPTLQAASKYATAAMGITADQLKAKQQATQQAINTVANMNDQALTAVFGMNRDQALQILNGNRQDLKDQLTQLINQSNNETNQMLGVEGATAMNNYNQSVAKKAQNDAQNNAFVNLGADLLSPGQGFLSGLDINSPMTSAPANYNPNMAPNQAAVLGY